MKKLFTNRWTHIILLITLLVGALAIRYTDPKPVERLRHIAFDVYNKLMPRDAGDDVVIIDIDEDSLRQFGQWPWPRTELAEMTTRLVDMGAKSVAYDIVFAEPDRTSPRFMAERFQDIDVFKTLPDNDDVFADAIAKTGKTVTAFVWTQQPTERNPIEKAKIFNIGFKPDPAAFVTSVNYFATNLPVLSQAAAGNGSFSMFPEQDGLIRRVPLLVGHKKADVTTIYPALSLEALRVALDKKIIKVKSFGVQTDEGYGINSIQIGDYTIPTDSGGGFWVYYSGHKPSRYVSAADVLTGNLDASKIKDKIVLVGTSAIGLLDLRSTPLDAVVPGVEVHAEIIEQILDGQFLIRPDYFDGAEILVTALISFMIILLAPFIGTTGLAALVVWLIMSGFAFAIYAFEHFGYLVDAIYPALTVTIIFILASILTNLRTDAEKRMIKNAFGHYISKDLMDELTQDPDKLRLGGEVRNLSVMFTDVRNFTTISESLSPEALIQLMNDFLTPMTSIVMDERGTVDKYMGDAMMAFWNAPLEVKDHAYHACMAALRMADALQPINDDLKAKAGQEGRDYHELRTGIGLATGPCSVGNMGAKQRFAYSALGDTVNLSSRLEGQTKGYGVPIMTDERTCHEAKDMAFLELDLLQVKGKTQPERVYTLMSDKKTGDFKTFKTAHDQMLIKYRAQNWDDAIAACKVLKSNDIAKDMTGYYDLIITRCKKYKKAPPAENWDGVFVATAK